MLDRKYIPLERERLSCEDMQVVVLMGGLGTRLKGLTAEKPKPLIDVNGKPFFEYEMDLLLQAGFHRFVFLVGYHARMIEDYFGNGSGSRYGEGVNIQYCHDGEQLLGTGGAIVNALPKLEEDFMLVYADSYMDVDYFEIVYRYFLGKQKGKKALMTVMENRNCLDKSNVSFKDGEILVYDKKNPSEHMEYIDYGIEVFHRSIFERLPPNEVIDLSDIQHNLTAENLCEACEVTNRFYEIGTPESLIEFRRYSQHRFLEPHKACFLDRDGVINEIVFNEDTEQLDSALSVEEFRFIDGALDGLNTFVNAGYDIYIVTNQPAAAKGKTTLAGLYDVNRHMVKLLGEAGITNVHVIMCPHHPAGSRKTKERFLVQKCNCRKPAPGMITGVLDHECVDKRNSYMIGDSFTDIQAGRAAGLKTAFAGNYKCDVCTRLKYAKPDVIGRNLMDIAGKVIGKAKL